MLQIAYQEVTVFKALLKIQADEVTSSSLSDISSSLRNIENVFRIQILQPLKSGLSMLADAEAEYLFNQSSGQELARKALESFNHAEGQQLDPQNQLVALIGKACAYRLLDMQGAYNSAAQKANQQYLDLQASKNTINNDHFMRLRRIVAKTLGVNPSQVTLEASFRSDLGADSLDAAEMIMAVEDEFSLEIPDEVAQYILTCQDALDFLEGFLES